MNQYPLVSIIIPVYNGENYMRDAIDSALNQTYQSIEILVVNDWSSDAGKTRETALSYGNRIRYFEKENGGVSSALNVGIRNMRGAYFSWLSHDDVYTPDKVEKEMDALMRHPEERCVALCRARSVDHDLNPIISAHGKRKTGAFPWKQAVMYITKYGADGCGMMIPRSAFEDAGLFDENLRYCQDILMWWQIFLAHYTLIVIPDECVLSRVHAQQTTQTQSHLYHHDAEYIGNIIPEKLLDVSTKDNNCIYEYARGEALHGNYTVYKRCIALAKSTGLLGLRHRAVLRALGAYGVVRPWIRAVYKALFCKIRSNHK